MKSEQITITYQVLYLTPGEAEWLKSVMQNPLGVSPEEEPEVDRDMRCKIFHNLEWFKGDVNDN